MWEGWGGGMGHRERDWYRINPYASRGLLGQYKMMQKT